VKTTVLTIISLLLIVSFASARGGHGGGHNYGGYGGGHSYRSYGSGHSYGSYSYSPGTGSKSSSTYVHGYMRKNGTYVEGYRRSTPDHSFENNWSTKGNVNPYTGKIGTRVTPPGAPYSRSYSYRSYSPGTTSRYDYSGVPLYGGTSYAPLLRGDGLYSTPSSTSSSFPDSSSFTTDVAPPPPSTSPSRQAVTSWWNPGNVICKTDIELRNLEREFRAGRLPLDQYRAKKAELVQQSQCP